MFTILFLLGFRPLSGYSSYLFSIESVIDVDFERKCFRPLSGYSSYLLNKEWSESDLDKGFRPLSGYSSYLSYPL